MTLTQIKPLGLSKPVDLVDNEKIRLGTGNDLEIYHENNKNLIKSIATTNTEIWSDTFYIKDTDGVAVFKGSKDGACELYYDGHAAFRTENVGAVLTDNSTSVTLRFETTQGQAGNITGIDNDNLIIQDNLGKDWLNMHKDGQVEIYHNGTKKLETHANGVHMSGSIYVPDSQIIGFGDTSNPDLRIYHDSSHSYIKDSGTGNLILQTSKLNINNADNTKAFIHTSSTDGVELYRDNSKRFETAPYGTIVTGSSSTVQEILATSDGSVRAYIYADNNNDVYILESQAHKVLKGSTNGATTIYYDNVEKFATEADGVKVTDANTSVHVKMVSSAGTAGYLYGSSDNQIGLLDNQGHWLIRGTKDGTAELMYDNTTRFKTLTDGTYAIGRAQVQCEGDSVCQLNATTHSSGAYHQQNLGNSGAVIAYVGHSSHLCTNPTTGNYAIRFEGDGLEFAKGSAIKARITQHGGIAFGSDTAANNTLDDYEEGQWTPTVNYGVVTSGSDALSYSVQQGWYVKIGGFVQASFYISFDAKGDGNDFTMGGLPFPSVNKPYNNLSYSSSGSLGYKDCNFTNNADQKIYVGNNAANIYYYNNNAGTHSPASSKLVSTGGLVGNALYGSVSYRAS